MVDALAGTLAISAVVMALAAYIGYWFTDEFWGIALGIAAAATVMITQKNLLWSLGKKVAGL